MNDPKYQPGHPAPGQPLFGQPYGGAPGAPPAGERISSIERAVRAFDRQEFVPPSPPGDMLPHALNPANYGAGPQHAPQGQNPMSPPPYGQPPMGAPRPGGAAPAGWQTQPGQPPFGALPQGQPHPAQAYPGQPYPAQSYPAPQANGYPAAPQGGPAAPQGGPGMSPAAAPYPQGAGAPFGRPPQPQPGPAPFGHMPQSPVAPNPLGYGQANPGQMAGGPGPRGPMPGFPVPGADQPAIMATPGFPGQSHRGQAGAGPQAAAYAPPSQPYAAGPTPQAPSPRPEQRASSRPNSYYPIDRRRLAELGMLGTESVSAGQVEEFRIVKRQIIEQADDMRRRGGGGAAQRVMVCSAHAGEGKTFCAVNLAMSISAEKESEVLLVDFDLARASVLQLLGLPPGPGLMEAIVDSTVDVRKLVMATDIPGLSVLPGGRPTNSDTEYLASSRAAQVLDMLTDDAPQRIVLFDSPPALAASIPAELAKLMGQVVLVVLADSTSSGAIQDAASLLAGCPNVQLLLNSVQFTPNGRRFGSYHGYRG